MVNEQHSYEGDAEWNVVGNYISPMCWQCFNALHIQLLLKATHGTTIVSIPIAYVIQEVHDVEERCKDQTYAMVTMLKMEGKKY